ncbi:sensor histidine kinase [Brevibacillus fluminis]|uniref:Oxygen sensor histidine kinase NreB n=1 Tax=Brevibacillus fluminis TaxID=511487 RepID=A0A3M8DVT7_9BACL|nr:sensor histidine kinase [Brevibacillus fluminis]RNB92288.1 sensor histidine kinase [Brevibacillus fluminis]
MQTQRRLASIQWSFVKQGLTLAVGTVVIVLGLLWLSIYWLGSYGQAADWLFLYLGIRVPFGLDWKYLLIFFVAAIIFAGILGVISGYVVGNLLKKRLNALWEAAMNLERGTLSYRVPELGADELGDIGWSFNRLAAKWEEQVVSLQRLSNHNAALGEQLRQAAVVEERQRLARELHDAVSQQLFAIAMTTAAIKRLMEKNPARAAQQIELVEEMASAAQTEMRALLLHLRPATLQDKSLGEAVVELLEELKQKQLLKITWELEEIDGMSSGIEDHLFRILQEALSNTLRHARADHIEVKLFTLQGQVRLRITDDGVGFDTDGEKMTSYGLVSIRERVAEVGGSLEIYSAIGKGTQLEVRIPLMEPMNYVETKAAEGSE